MLIRIILAVDSPALAGRFRQILEQPDCHLETIKPGESLWEAVSRGSFDLIVIAHGVLLIGLLS